MCTPDIKKWLENPISYHWLLFILCLFLSLRLQCFGTQRIKHDLKSQPHISCLVGVEDSCLNLLPVCLFGLLLHLLFTSCSGCCAVFIHTLLLQHHLDTSGPKTCTYNPVELFFLGLFVFIFLMAIIVLKLKSRWCHFSSQCCCLTARMNSTGIAVVHTGLKLIWHHNCPWATFWWCSSFFRVPLSCILLYGKETLW